MDFETFSKPCYTLKTQKPQKYAFLKTNFISFW